MSAESARVLITGGASGLGLALAKIYAVRGSRVLAADLGSERPAQLPDAVAYRMLDVRDEADWAAARDWVQREWGGLDLLFNNAGVATGGRIDVESMVDWQRVVDINLLGVVRGCRTFTPLLKKQGSGRIVNTASLAGLVHGPGMSSYNAVKAGVVALSETLHFELGPFGVAVSVICPGFFRTNLYQSFRGTDSALERSGSKRISSAKLSADEIAWRVVKSVDSGKRLILTDGLGRAAYWSKRLATPLYAGSVRAGARRMAGRSPEVAG